LFVLPSYAEALPTTLIESVINKKPVLATDVGEVKKIISNQFGLCGTLLKPSKGINLIKEISEKLIEIKNGKTKYDFKSFDEANKKFSIKQMANNYLEFFSKTITS